MGGFLQSLFCRADKDRLIALAAHVRAKTHQLHAAITAASPHHPVPKGSARMPQVIDDLVAAVAAEDAVIDSAIKLIGGISSQIDTAVAAALANGATAAQLAPVSDLIANVKAETQKLADAVAAVPAPTPAP